MRVRQFRRRVVSGSRREEDTPRGNPPPRVAVGVDVATLGFEHRVGDSAAVDSRDEPRSESQLVALAGQRERLQLAEREECECVPLGGAQVIRAVQGPNMLDQALLREGRPEASRMKSWGRRHGADHRQSGAGSPAVS